MLLGPIHFNCTRACTGWERPLSPRYAARQAVTLVELVVVLLIIGITTAAAMPKFVDSLGRARVDMAANRIAQDLTYVKRQALSASTSGTVQFVPNSDTYSVTGVAGINLLSLGYSVNLAQEPYGVDLISVSFGGSQSISFSRFALPSAGGSVVVGRAGYQRTIVVDSSTGKAAVQ